ncbi:hypothetical protein [Nocardia terpenica]|uniref:Uncharacterized protein n=1 Tax=Nocardia terpenica TaxID=455432 RepID=A0A6G9ZA42_9NOCA|nr:hypothetical protein [Nocardia terpenica]QIS22408.1 hypothetical protein F6W96_32815 [Nocardia terpenica]
MGDDCLYGWPVPPQGGYVAEDLDHSLTGIHHDRLRTSVPFDIDLDLSAATRRWIAIGAISSAARILA